MRSQFGIGPQVNLSVGLEGRAAVTSSVYMPHRQMRITTPHRQIAHPGEDLQDQDTSLHIPTVK